MSVNSPFGVTKFQLMGLMSTSHRPKERDEMLAEYGGVMGLADHLQTDPKKGISVEPSKLEMRKKEFGVNFIPPVPPKSFLALAFDAIQDKTLVILMIAAVVSIVLGVTVEEQKDIAWIEGFAILCAVFLVVIVTAVNDWTKERQFRGLQKKLDTTSKLHVKRGETSELLQVSTILVGDLVQFGYGNSLPVDGILYEGNDVKVDESAMTGEALLVKKRVDNNPFLFAGTRVMEGRGKMLVTAVGPNSQQGIIFQLMTQREEEAGFITHNYRRLRDFVTCKEKEKDVESGEKEKEEEEDVEVKEYEPDQPVDEEEPLTGCSRLNMFKRMQLAKEKRQRDKKKAAQKETEKKKKESGSLLQKKLDKFAIRIGYAGTAAAIFCIAVLSAKFSIEKFWIDGESWDASTDYSELLHFVIIGITVLVVAVPEGLPLAVTIALAFSVKKMLKDNNLVRHLHACETMGNATSICSDKTGTLTTNRMTVVESYFAGTRFEVTPATSDIPESILEVLRLNIAVNSSYTSKLIPDDAGDREEAKGFVSRLKAFLPFKSAPGDGLLGQGLAKQVGNVTECALLGFLVELGIDYEAIRDEHPTDSLTKVFTFNSARKSMSTVITLPNGGHRLLTKGASEIVLNKCTSILGENGRIKHLSNSERKELEVNVVQSMASNALRTLCIAYRDFPPADDSDPDISSVPDWDEEDSIVSDLTCVGIVGIQDPVRPEVPTSILKCQQAGVTVRMVTGDNIETARAIAEKCGIISKGDGYLVMEGREFNRRVKDSNGEVSQDRMDRIWHRLRVLARSSPTDKHVLVNGIIESRLRKNREVVAVTGDGTNDGPALKRADVGFAMGIAGTDVAKEACDIILTDDNFTSIVKAVMWGRNVYDSISKFLQFQLTINIVAVLLAIISAFTIGDTPLRAVQLLWVNLIMDTLASLALATEAPTEELLKRKPYGRTKSLISRYMWLFIIGHSLYQLTVMFVLVFAGAELFDIDEGSGRELRADPTEHFTLVFNTFVSMQIFNEINARKIHGERNVFTHIHRNFIFIGVMIGQVSIQIIIVEFGDIVFSTSGLTLDLWLWCIFLGSTELIIEQLLLFIPVQKIPIFWKEKEEEPDLEEDNRARYLWVKSLTRVRTQIRVVNAFRASLESGEQLHISRLPHYTSTPRGPRYFSSSPSSKETTV